MTDLVSGAFPLGESALPRRHLARQLRQFRRDHARLTLHDAAHQLRWPASKLEDLEHGDIRPRPQDVAALCALYGVDEHTAESLVAIATHTQTNTWPIGHTPDPMAIAVYPQLLEHAGHIREYQPIFVPDLLQIQAYARLHLAETVSDPDTLDQRVAARRHRARLLTRTNPEPPQFIAVLDEQALRQLPHRPDIMADQLHHLAALGEQPNVRIRIMPFAAGPHPAVLMPGFTVLDFPDRDGPVPLQPPRFTDAGDLDDRSDTGHYRAAFSELLTIALDEEASRELLLATARSTSLTPVRCWA